jgi:hypothetical protein
MTKISKSFWLQTNVIFGLSFMLIGYFLPLILALLSPSTFKLIESEYTLNIGQYKASINSVLFIAGLIILLYPKLIKIGFFQKIFGRINGRSIQK